MIDATTGDSALTIDEELSIPLSEIRLRFTRSSGPGGQNVNRTSTRVELLLDVRNSPSFTDEQRALIERRLRSYIDQDGVLHLVSQSTRSQYQNRQDVLARLAALLAASLRKQPKRVATRPTRASKERRIGSKRARSQIKRTRGRVGHEDLGE
ncbi:MAG: alternative ribosome rescue aminoacyl-tRNA hydrolase ArfB [Anaerolineae bacterium]